IIMTMGDHAGHEGGTNSLRLVQIGEDGFVEYNPSLDICPIDLDKHVQNHAPYNMVLELK
ncbi:MAG: hypothetical protein GY732_12385, partial [Gammaproteobacteria bacterium]|nr:hypothetical protein [Gammaproteobacteria bacterium]